MKTLFSNPPWFSKESDNILRKGVRAGSRWPNTYPALSKQDEWPQNGWHYAPYPFFMGYAASYAKRAFPGHDITMRDSVVLHEGYDKYYALLKEQAFDMIVIESATPCWEHDERLIAMVKHHCPSAQIVVAGPIATALGPKIIADGIAVAAIEGEYEKGVVRVIGGERGHIHHDMLTRDEMNAAPFPIFNKSESWRYYDACPYSPITPHAHIWSSRGCPFRCSFCSWPAIMTNNDADGTGKRTVRHYTPEYMEAFIAMLVKDHGIKSIYFDDDTFNLGAKHVERICGVMRKAKLPWAAMCRADTIPRETWRLMRDSGCYGVKLGFESGNQHLVDTVINKGLDLKEARQTVIYLRRLGMTVHGTFTYGHPGETKEQMQETRAFIQSMPLNSWQESGTALLGSTPLATMEEQGKIAASFSRETDGNKKFNEIREQLAAMT